MKAALVALLAAAVLAGCASSPDADIEPIPCVEWHTVAITVGDRVYLVRGSCKAWLIGPTREQRERFDRRMGPRP